MQATLKRRLTGIAPLLISNVRMANPLDTFAKALKRVTSKRAKTDADFEEMAKIEWYGALYLTHGRICIPGTMVAACLVAAAKKLKKGVQAKAGLYCMDDFVLEYEGSIDIDELWASKLTTFTVPVRQQGRSIVMRTRPRFETWAIDAEVAYNTDLLNESDIDEFFRIGGRDCALGTWRPRHGRFEVL